MTAARRSRKRHVYGLAGARRLLAVVGAVASAPRAATTERVVVDRHTGLALYGIDPVAYFTDRKPVAGRADFEYRYAGAVWRFDNEGNRAAFAADPEVYMPRFGGYDPVGVARGLCDAGLSRRCGSCTTSGSISSIRPRRAAGLHRQSRGGHRRGRGALGRR